MTYKKAFLTVGRTILTVLLCITSLPGQDSIINELQNRLSQSQDPLQRIDYQLGLARAYMFQREPKPAMEYAQQALTLSQENYLLAEQAKAMCFVMMLDEVEGADHYSSSNEALRLAKESGDPDAIAFATYLHVEFAQYNAVEGKELLESFLDEYSDRLSIKNKGNVFKVLAWQYEQLGELALAEKTYLDAVHLFAMIRDSIIIDPKLGRESAGLADRGKGNLSQCLSYLGEVYIKMGDFDKAIESCERALDIARDMPLSEFGFVQGRLGNVHAAAGNIDQAIQAYTTAAEVHKEVNDQITRSIYLMRIGDLFSTIGDYDQAREFYSQSFELISHLDYLVAPVMMAFGQSYDRQSNYDLALRYYQTGDSLYQILKDTINIIGSQLKLAGVQSKSGLTELAISKMQKLVPIVEQLNNTLLSHTVYISFSDSYQRQGNMTKALQYANLALNLAKQKTFDKELIKRSHFQLYQLYKANHDDQLALHHHEQFQLYSDSIQTLQAQELLKREEVKQNIATFEKEKQQAQRQAQLLRQRNNLYIGLAAALALLLGGMIYFLNRLSKARKQVAKQNQELQELNRTKDRFFGIIAHDIKSPMIALESVEQQMAYYTRKNKPEKILEVGRLITNTAENLNRLLANLLNWAMVQTGQIPYQPEVLDVSNILNDTVDLLEQNANVKQIVIKKNFNDHIEVFADHNAVATIFRNLLSNAIKFTRENGVIEINGQCTSNVCSVSIVDSGIGMSDEKISQLFTLQRKSEVGTAGEKGTGLGLVLCKDLVQQNSGQIDIVSAVGLGTTITVTLPVSNPI